ncbi:MAG: hypothetical protein ACI4MH_03205 [Candidatus Coproplasma sp.]
MNKDFKKFKNKFILNAALAAALCGISAGAIAFGAVWLVLKLIGISFLPLYYVLIGVGVALIVGVSLFFVFKPSDKRVAKLLDDQLMLDERVQTMVEYQGEESDMLTLQREDAEQRLANSPRLKPSIKKIAKLAIMPVLACAVVLTAAFVPEKQDPPEPDDGIDDNYEMNNWQLSALSQLIDEVQSSALQENLKQSHVAVLEGLLEGLKQTTSQSAMVASVRSAIAMLATATGGIDGYSVFVEEYSQSENAAISAFGEGLADSAKVYSTSVKLTQFSLVQEREPLLYDQALAVLLESTEELISVVGDLTELNFRTEISNFAVLFELCLGNLDFSNNDAIARAISVLVNGMRGVISNYDTGGYALENLKSQVSDVCTSYAQSAATEMAVQSYALMVTEYETNRLCAIFGVKTETSDNPDGGSDPVNPDEDDPGEGGWGQGGVNYGSDDIIFFPNEGIYVQYGEVLNVYYYPKVSQLLREGNVSEEAKQFIREYFTILNRGIKDDEAEEN